MESFEDLSVSSLLNRDPISMISEQIRRMGETSCRFAWKGFHASSIDLL